jgi:predicted DsbA family dithiol-disulfide isomerase
VNVPCFIIDRKYAVSGAQLPEVFHQVFDLVNQEQSQAAE